MNWRKVLSVVFAGVMLTLAGCSVFGGGGGSTASNGVAIVKDTIGGIGGVNFGVLDVIAVLAALGAAATLVMWGFGMPVPSKVTLSLVALTVGAWVLKLILVKFLWIIMVLCILALVLLGCVIAYTHLGWLEKRLNKDLNKNGTVGT